MRTYRTIVVGLGAMGSAAAAAVARRGVDVLGLEQFAPLHDRGSSHGDSRIVRMAYFEHPDYVPLLRRAYDGWAELERASGRPLIRWTGALMIGRSDSAVVAGTLASATSWQLPHEVLDGAAMAARFPQFNLAAGEVAVHEHSAGVVDPEAAVEALHVAARRPAPSSDSSRRSTAGMSAATTSRSVSGERRWRPTTWSSPLVRGRRSCSAPTWR